MLKLSIIWKSHRGNFKGVGISLHSVSGATERSFCSEDFMVGEWVELLGLSASSETWASPNITTKLQVTESKSQEENG